MSSNVDFDMNGSGRTGSTSPDAAAWIDSCSAACRQAARRLSAWSDATARYLSERDIEDIAADLTALARARPGQTLAIAALLGALVGGVIYGFGRPR